MIRKRTGAGDLWFKSGTGLFALVLVAIVVGIGLVLWYRSTASIHAFGFRFWSTDSWDPVSEVFGARPFIWGTLYSSLLALIISTPIALGIAIFISELCPNSLRQPVAFLTELLAAIPSIVYGVWGIFVLVPAIRAFESSFPDWLRAWPIFSGPAVGVGMMSAAVVLAIMIVPFSSSVAREVLKAVPNAQREGAHALGATRWEATCVALYYARTGIIGSILLGLGRALGETMAVTMVIGNTPQVSWSMFAPQYTMAAVIANEFSEASSNMHISALVEIGLVLLIITLIVNIASRLLIWSMTRERSYQVITAPLVPETTA